VKTTFLNIHDFLTVQINQPYHREFVKDINQPFSYFETQGITKPDIILNIGNFEPQKESCSVVDHKCHIKEGYIYCSDRLQKIPFKVEIKGLESFPTIINAYVKNKKLRQYILPSALVQNIFLRPIIDFKLLQKGILSVHAAAVSNSHGAVVLLGRGGTFKTTLEMDLIRKKGYKFLGDDRILLFKGKAYCYPLHHKLFEFRASGMKTEDYGRFDKIRYLIYQKKNPRASDFIVQSANLFKILCMVKFEGTQLRTRRFDREILIKKTVKSQMLENIKSPVLIGISAGKLYEYFAVYSFVFPQSRVASYWADYGSLIGKYFPGDDFMEICLPEKYTSDIFRQFTDLIERQGHQT